MGPRTGITMTRQTAAFVILVAGSALTGCRGDRSDEPPRQFFPDMDDQPKVKAQGRSTFYKDYTRHESDRLAKEGERFGRSMREPVIGTVPFGYRDEAEPVRGMNTAEKWINVDFSRRAEMLRADDDFYLGFRPLLDKAGQPVKNADGVAQVQYLEYIPASIRVDEEFIRLGQKKFNIYCIVCHGGTGEGNGMVGQRWATPLPNWHDPKYDRGGEKGQDGYIFFTIRNGVSNPGGPPTMPLKMPSYATKLSEYESWAVVAYFRSLRETRKGVKADVPAAQWQELEKVRDHLTPPPAPAGTMPATPAAPAPAAGGAK